MQDSATKATDPGRVHDLILLRFALSKLVSIPEFRELPDQDPISIPRDIAARSLRDRVGYPSNRIAHSASVTSRLFSALQNLQQHLCFSCLYSTGHDLLRQPCIGDLQAVLIFDHRQVQSECERLTVKEAIWLAADSGGSARLAVVLHMLAAFCTIGSLQVFEFLRSLGNLFDPLK